MGEKNQFQSQSEGQGPAALKPVPAVFSLAALMRYLRIYAALWKNSVIREMSFKSNFLLWIVVELLWFALQLAFITVIYQHTDWIGDWSKWQVVLLMGASHLIQQIFQAFFLTNCTQISEYVRTGKLDFMLLLPINTRFILSLRQVDLGGFVNGASAVAVITYALFQLHYVPSALQIISFLLLAGAGVFVHYSLMFLLASISFWTVRAQGIVWGYYSLFTIARLPDEAYRGFFKVFFTFAVPMILVANVPARVLAAKLKSPLEMILLLAMSIACWLISELGWRLSLRRYTSASS
jgi:ABC-2 type transport system permease protein